MREYLALSGKLRTRYQKEHWFLAAAGVYRRALVTLADALAGIELAHAALPRSGSTSRTTPSRRCSPAWPPTSPG